MLTFVALVIKLFMHITTKIDCLNTTKILNLQFNNVRYGMNTVKARKVDVCKKSSS